MGDHQQMMPRCAASASRRRYVFVAVALAVAAAGAAACTRPQAGRIAATWPRADSERSALTTPLPSLEASVEVEVPSNDPGQQRKDQQGRLPEEVLIQLIESINEGDWKTAYAAYASPGTDFATFKRERERAAEVYDDFAILETRLYSNGTASARVTYAMHSEADSQAAVTVSEPGEWWGLTLAGGVWKVNWLPRQ